MPEWVTLAVIRRERGNKGEVACQCLTSGAERFDELGSVWLFSPSGEPLGEKKLDGEAWEHKGLVVLKFEGIDSISDAAKLRGLQVRIPEELRPELPDGEFYFGDLIGCRVADADDGTVYGQVAAVHEQGVGTGLLELDNELLIPFTDEICVSIRPEEGEIEVRLPKGLLEVNG